MPEGTYASARLPPRITDVGTSGPHRKSFWVSFGDKLDEPRWAPPLLLTPFNALACGMATSLDLSGTFGLGLSRGAISRPPAKTLYGDLAAIGRDFYVAFDSFRSEVDPDQQVLFDPDDLRVLP